MDEKKIVLPLDLQFFTEGDDGGNPPQPSDGRQPIQPPTDDGKKFTQEDLNRINIKGKNDELKRILKATGFEKEEDLIAYLGKVKNYDDISSENAKYKEQEIKNTYCAEIRKNNVADEYIDTIYLTIKPTENEKIEDYNKRVSEYLKTHKAFLNPNIVPPSFTNSNLNYRSGDNGNKSSLPFSLIDAIKEEQNNK